MVCKSFDKYCIVASDYNSSKYRMKDTFTIMEWTLFEDIVHWQVCNNQLKGTMASYYILMLTIVILTLHYITTKFHIDSVLI